MVARSANAVATMKAWGAQVQGTTTVPMMPVIRILMTALNQNLNRAVYAILNLKDRMLSAV